MFFDMLNDFSLQQMPNQASKPQSEDHQQPKINSAFQLLLLFLHIVTSLHISSCVGHYISDLTFLYNCLQRMCITADSDILKQWL
jgi:hypothetical protein